MLKIYSKSNCPHCDSAKQFLQAKGIEFEVVDIEKDSDARESLCWAKGIDLYHRYTMAMNYL